MKKVLLVSHNDPSDKRSWSGTEYNILSQLRLYYEVDVVRVSASLAPRIDNALALCLTGGRHVTRFGLMDSIVCGARTHRAIERHKCDLVFVLGSKNLAFLRTSCPVVYFTDATVHGMKGYYWDMGKIVYHFADYVQNRCLRNADAILASSSWAIKDIVDHYNVPEEKCSLCLLGANVSGCHDTGAAGDDDVLNLLFVGVEWERKGGDIAVRTLSVLKGLRSDRYARICLHIVGCTLPDDIGVDGDVVCHGRLDRNVPAQEMRLERIYCESDVFILPTKAECAGIVFCEASAYGLPIVTYDTGGISDYVVDGVNGYRLPAGSDERDFAAAICSIIDNPDRAASMRENGLRLYKERLNWDSFGRSMKDAIDAL